MSSELSPYAVHRILYFVENDRRVERTKALPAKKHPRSVSKKWLYVYTAYFIRRRSIRPPLDYLRSMELALFLTCGMDSKAIMPTVFKYGQPLAFDRDLPRLFVPAIIEAFRLLKEKPPFIDVTLSDWPESFWPMRPSEMWPKVYVDHLPCGACTKVDEPDKTTKNKQHLKHRRENSAKHERFVVEKFHIHSKHFHKQLTVGLHFALADPDQNDDAVRPATAAALEKRALKKVTICLDDPPCTVESSGTSRVSKSRLLIPEYASEVYGFLDRAHVGTSLLANRDLNELILRLKNRLPVHHLICEFAQILEGDIPISRTFNGAYWMVLGHFLRELPYSDVRKFEVPSKDGPAADCSLLRRYLSNSYLSDFESPEPNFRFAVKLLAALADRNFSLGNVRMCAKDYHVLRGPDYRTRFSDYRSMNTVFNAGMQLDALELSFFEHDFIGLIKATAFFHMSAVQKLKVLKLKLGQPRFMPDLPHRSAIVSSPLWIAGIRAMRKSELFEVKYECDRHLRTIGLKLFQLCEKFERGEISELVQHFKFVTRRQIAFPFKEDNRTASEVQIGYYKWDVYRFRNATNTVTDEWLTACVGHAALLGYSVLHIVKGDAFPDASFDA